MAESGKIKGAYNVKQFEEFISRHNRDNNWGKYTSPNMRKLVRGLICKECSFGRSALFQNELLKKKLEHLEEELQQRGILINESLEQPNYVEYPDQAIFIKAFEDRVAHFKAKSDMLRPLLENYSLKLDKLD